MDTSNAAPEASQDTANAAPVHASARSAVERLRSFIADESAPATDHLRAFRIHAAVCAMLLAAKHCSAEDRALIERHAEALAAEALALIVSKVAEHLRSFDDKRIDGAA